jgi:ribonuclease HI
MSTAPAPAAGYFLLFTDAGMRSGGRPKKGATPGEAAIGVVLMDRKLRPIKTISRAIGLKTHNVAEYSALIEGLKLARRHGVTNVRAYLDSQMVVDQVNGNSKVREAHLAPLHSKVEDQLRDFKSWRIAWIPREMNREADALASKALRKS